MKYITKLVKLIFLIVVMVTNFAMTNTLAQVREQTFSPADVAWVSTLSVGPAWANAGATQTFYLAPEIEKTYAADKSINTFTSYELFTGIQKALPPKLLGQFGFAIARTGNARLQGTIWDDADPAFANHTYQFDILPAVNDRKRRGFLLS